MSCSVLFIEFVFSFINKSTIPFLPTSPGTWKAFGSGVEKLGKKLSLFFNILKINNITNTINIIIIVLFK